MKSTMGARSYPKPRSARRLGLVLLLALVAACHTAPVTGRRQLNFFSTQDDIELGREAYAQVLSEGKAVPAGPQHDMVQRAMTRISAVAEVDYPGAEWEANLLQDDKTVNAFALPGGKMAVYTGILPVCQGETGLAVVMGHEIGHVVARHGTERITSTYGLDLVLSLINLGDYTQLAQMTMDVAVNLPFGRKQESEADEIGLIYMARAGYDPREAVAFWERMESLGGDAPPEFLSTHPSHETRVEGLKKKLPQALEEWKRATAGGPR